MLVVIARYVRIDGTDGWLIIRLKKKHIGSQCRFVIKRGIFSLFLLELSSYI